MWRLLHRNTAWKRPTVCAEWSTIAHQRSTRTNCCPSSKWPTWRPCCRNQDVHAPLSVRHYNCPYWFLCLSATCYFWSTDNSKNSSTTRRFVFKLNEKTKKNLKKIHTKIVFFDWFNDFDPFYGLTRLLFSFDPKCDAKSIFYHCFFFVSRTTKKGEMWTERKRMRNWEETNKTIDNQKKQTHEKMQ